MTVARPPSFWKWLREPLMLPKILSAPYRKPENFPSFGKGRPALVIPGMLSGDGATALLRASLDNAGFASAGWEQPFNVQVSEGVVKLLEKQLDDMTERAGKRAIIIGWSLGGFYARVLANRRPQDATLVMTMGTPFSGSRRANRAWRLYEFLNDHTVDNAPFAEDFEVKPPMRTLALWSSVDGIVAPESARGRLGESDRQIEFPFRHFAMGTSKTAIRSIIEILEEELAAA